MSQRYIDMVGAGYEYILTCHTVIGPKNQKGKVDWLAVVETMAVVGGGFANCLSQCVYHWMTYLKFQARNAAF